MASLDPVLPRRQLTRGLSSLVVGAPLQPADEPAGPRSSTDDEPLRRQSTSQLNRSRVQENQRILAAQLLQFSLPLMGLAVLVVLALIIASVVIYVKGWFVLTNFADKPCDQPLKFWLLVVLWVPIIQFLLTCWSSPEQRPKRIQAIVTPLAIIAGLWMVCHCKTCQKSAPELYAYAKLYLIFQSCVWLVSLVMSCGIVSLIFWAHRNGYLDTGPGPLMAARPGLINDIETVTFHASDFAQNVEDEQPPECSICVEDFTEGEDIKRTPCGHYFCKECLSKWLSDYAKSCPLCRTDLEQALDGGGDAQP